MDLRRDKSSEAALAQIEDAAADPIRQVMVMPFLIAAASFGVSPSMDIMERGTWRVRSPCLRDQHRR